MRNASATVASLLALILTFHVGFAQTASGTAGRYDEYSKLILPGPGDEVESVAFSPDGKVLASGSRDQTVKLWDSGSGELMRTFTRHSGGLDSIAFSPDGTILAISSSENAVDLYDASSGNLMRSLAGCTIAGHAAFSPDGKLLVTKSLSQKRNLQVWNVQTGELYQVLTDNHGGLNRIAFAPNGKVVAAIGSVDEEKPYGGQSLRLWDMQTGKVVMSLTDFKYSLVDLAFSPDGNTIAVAGEVTIIFRDAETGKLRSEIHSDVPSRNFEPPVRSITYSPDGKLLAVSSYDNLFTVLDVAAGKPKYAFLQDSRPTVAVFSPDGNSVVTGCQPKAIYFWDLKTAKLKIKIGNEAQSFSVAFAPDGKTIASDGGFFYHAISLWDAGTGKLLRTLSGHDNAIAILLFSPDGKLLCGADTSADKVYIWDSTSGEMVHTLELEGESEPGSIDFSPDGKVLAVAGGYGDGTIKLFNTQTWQLRRTLIASRPVSRLDPITKKIEAANLGVDCARFSLDGKTLAAVIDEGAELKFWNSQTGVLVRRLPLKNSNRASSTKEAYALSPDLKLVISGLDILNAATGALVRRLPGPGRTGLAFSNDGKVLATTGTDMIVRLWAVLNGKQISTLTGHSNDVSSAEFSPDGQTLVTGSKDGTVRLWNVSTGELKRMCIIGNS